MSFSCCVSAQNSVNTRVPTPFPTLARLRYLDTFEMVRHLHEHREDAANVRILCIRLVKQFLKSPAEVEFFLPQICHFLMVFNPSSFIFLERMVLQLSSISVHFALLLRWFLVGVIEDSGKEKQTNFQRAAKLLLGVEAAVTRDTVHEKLLEDGWMHLIAEQYPHDEDAGGNASAVSARALLDDHRDNPGSDTRSPNVEEHEHGRSDSAATRDKLLHDFLVAQGVRRRDFFDAAVEWIKTLTKIPAILKDTPPGEQRKRQLQFEMGKVSGVLGNASYIPLGSSGDNFCKVVTVVPSECRVFSTKERAPFMLCVETVKSQKKNGAPDAGWAETFFWKRQGIKFTDGGATPADEISTQTAAIPIPTPPIPNNTENFDSISEREASSFASATSVMPYEDGASSYSGSSQTGAKLKKGTLKEPLLSDVGHSERTSVAEKEMAMPDADVAELMHGSRNEDLYSSTKLSVGSLVGETWKQRKAKIKNDSKFSRKNGWDFQAVIVKSNDDLRQEVFAMQLIYQIDKIWTAARLPLKLTPYKIVSTGADSGLIEGLGDAVSVDAIKKSNGGLGLQQIFERTFGKNTRKYEKAVNNFASSLAAYSLTQYILQIKDRHNGNILIDSKGRMIHIDFGFLLTTSPGNMGFENAPFKFTLDYMQLLGGRDSALFQKFVSLCVQGFLTLRANKHLIVSLVEMMLPDCPFASLRLGSRVVDQINTRLQPGLSTKETVNHVVNLIDLSIGSWRTKQYDSYQRATNGIVP